MDIKYSGFVSLAGMANVGKSTLLNAIIGKKVAIVSPRPQTTRNRIVGIKNIDDKQLVFIDTPGLHIPKTVLGDFMMKTANENIIDADIVVLITLVKASVSKLEQNVIDNVKKSGQQCILVINKTDLIKDKPRIMETIALFSKLHDFEAVVPLCAKTGKGVDLLINELLKLIREGVQYYPDEMITDQPERVYIAEVIREKLLYAISDEVPHGIAIEINEYKLRESGDIYDISVNIICEKKGHKSIIIGHNGEKLKAVATAARKDLEESLGKKVNLQCWVKTKEDWRNNQFSLRNYGYE